MKDIRLTLFQTGFRTMEIIRPAKAREKAVILFSSPRKFTRPNREKAFMAKSRHYDVPFDFKASTVYNTDWPKGKVDVPAFNDDGPKTSYHFYELGEGPAVLLVHGWGGRASQMGKIAQALADNGYKAVSFDGFAHGESPGNQSTALEFAAIIAHIQKNIGPFEAIVGHSLGGMAGGIAINDGVKAKKLVTIGSPTSIDCIVRDFCSIINASPKTGTYLKDFLQGYAKRPLDAFSLAKIGEKLTLPGLIIHDHDDKEVAFEQSLELEKSWKNGRLWPTEGLGHSRILRDKRVIEKITDFIKS